MNIDNRIYRLENTIGIKPATGLPIRPDSLTDAEYEQAIADKRKELGLTPAQPIPIMALCGFTSELPE